MLALLIILLQPDTISSLRSTTTTTKLLATSALGWTASLTFSKNYCALICSMIMLSLALWLKGSYQQPVLFRNKLAQHLAKSAIIGPILLGTSILVNIGFLSTKLHSAISQRITLGQRLNSTLEHYLTAISFTPLCQLALLILATSLAIWVYYKEWLGAHAVNRNIELLVSDTVLTCSHIYPRWSAQATSTHCAVAPTYAINEAIPLQQKEYFLPYMLGAKDIVQPNNSSPQHLQAPTIPSASSQREAVGH